MTAIQSHSGVQQRYGAAPRTASNGQIRLFSDHTSLFGVPISPAPTITINPATNAEWKSRILRDFNLNVDVIPTRTDNYILLYSQLKKCLPVHWDSVKSEMQNRPLPTATQTALDNALIVAVLRREPLSARVLVDFGAQLNKGDARPVSRDDVFRMGQFLDYHHLGVSTPNGNDMRDIIKQVVCLLIASVMPVFRDALEKLIEIIGVRINHQLEGVNLAGANLVRVDMSRAKLSKANFEGADMRGGNFHASDLRWANLRNANLEGANLENADLTGADLRGAHLINTNLAGTILTGARLEDTILFA